VNDVAGALNAYREGLDIMRGLVSDNPTNALWTEFALSMLEQIAELKSRQHDLQAALQARREMLRLLRPGNDRRLQNAEWRRHEPEILRKLGELLMALGDSTAAIAAYRESLDISRAMAADDAAADAATSASHLH
jgi:tetratricopeptide (TPR) repeat protein